MNLNFYNRQDSVKFTILNLFNHLAENPYNPIINAENKMNFTEKSFKELWHMDEKLFKKQFIDYVKMCQKENEYDIVDFIEADKYHHLNLHININYGDMFKNKKRTLAYVYTVYYQLQMSLHFPNYFTKFTYPYIVDDRYVAYITFDEDEVSNVQTIATENMYNIESELFLVDVTLKGGIFTKVSDLQQNK